jgi:hypothetical protein
VLQVFRPYGSRSPGYVHQGIRESVPTLKVSGAQKGRARPAIWCSQTRRRAAYEERSAAGSGAVAVEVVDRIRVSEHDLSECVDGVTGSPAACRRVLKALAHLARDGTLASDPKWGSTVAAARGLIEVIDGRQGLPTAALVRSVERRPAAEAGLFHGPFTDRGLTRRLPDQASDLHFLGSGGRI